MKAMVLILKESGYEKISIKKNGIDIYEMIEELREQGLYFAEHRAES
ncbi:MAG: hypothetical protein ACRDBO_19480 [Lachnospiraceae bacterium]